MHRHAIIFAWLLAVGIAAAAPKTALVRVGEVYDALPAAKELEQQITAEKQEIMQSPYAKAYQTARKELEALYASIRKLPEQEKSGQERARQEFAVKRQKAESLQKDFEAYYRDRMETINLFRVDGMEKILADIRSKAAEVGRDRGYAWVLDSEGHTNSTVPFVLYSKGADDITTEVLQAFGVSETGDDSN